MSIFSDILFPRITPSKDFEVSFTEKQKTSNSVTASAEVINLKRANGLEALNNRLRETRSWQKNAYEYYRLIGDVHYLISLIADQVSKVNLYIGVNTDTSKVPSSISEVDNDTVDNTLKANALTILRMIENAEGGTSTFLKRIALSLQIAGECFIIEEPVPYWKSSDKQKLYVRSVNEISIDDEKGEKVIKVFSSGDTKSNDFEVIPSTNLMVRIWNPDPEYYAKPDSPMLGILDDCDSYLNLRKTMRVVSRSQQSAGILVIPDEFKTSAEIAFAEDSINFDDDHDTPELSAPKSLEEEIAEALTSPASNESSASTIVPYILRGTAESSEKIRYIDISRKDDDNTGKIKDILRSILGGLDITPEIANAILSSGFTTDITSQLYKSTVESMIISICNNLSGALLRKHLVEHFGHTAEEVANLVIWYDPSAITLDPDMSDSADFGIENGTISLSAWRRVHGYSEADSPTEIETAITLLKDKGIISQDATDRTLALSMPSVFNGIEGRALTPDATAFNKEQSKPPEFLLEPSKSSSGKPLLDKDSAPTGQEQAQEQKQEE